MFDVIDATALTLAAAVVALITVMAVVAAESRLDPHRYDASRCPRQNQGEEMKIPLTSHAAILTRIAELEGRLTALELRMGVYDRHDGDDQYDDTPEDEE